MTKIHVKQQAGMKGKIVALATIGAVVALSIVAASLWVPQGPITFDEERYRLGESIFMKVRGLQTNDGGNIMIYTPLDVLFSSRQYDGSSETDFNFYFTPDTVKHREICTPEELVGKWKVVFEDGTYPPAYFEMTSEYLPGSEKHLDVVC